MELLVQLFLAVGVFGITLSGGSLVWPHFTNAPRPQLLQQVHDRVVKTPVGFQAARVLGVTDDKTIQPVNMGQVVGSVGNSIKSAVQKRAQSIITAQIVGQLSNRFEKLPKDQQKQLQEIVCPTSSTASGVVQ
jgi:hypothetical protein